ncbi:MAG: A24 family peptidase [Candidatus Bathyarchaeota archaeon]
MNITGTLEIIKIIISFSFLAISSYYDYKYRIVPDKIFIIFAPMAGILTLAGFFFTGNFLQQLETYLFYVAISFAIFFVIGYVGLFGGADVKIMIVLSLAVPWPLISISPILGVTLPILPLSIFDNSLILSILTLPYALVSNIAWKNRNKISLFKGVEKEPLLNKIGAILFCVKKEKRKVRPFDLIAEKSGKLTLFNKVREEDLTQEEIQGLPNNVFVTFALPFVIFIFIGFITTIFLGDLVIILVKSLLHF